MSKKKPVISFYYPSKNIGGAQLLFSRIAAKLVNLGWTIKVYEESPCYISEFLHKNMVDFIQGSTVQNHKFVVSQDELFILSLSYATRIIENFDFKTNSRFIFWDLHPFSLIQQLDLPSFYLKIRNRHLAAKCIHIFERDQASKIRTLVHTGTKNNGLVFMSAYNFMVNKQLFKLNPEYKIIPIPLPPVHFNNKTLKTTRTKNYKPLRLGWMSRLARNKNNTLSLLVDDIAATQNNNIELIIIGDGRDRTYIENYVNRKNLQNVRFVGTIASEELPNYIKKNIDLGISVGTSALEFGLAGIPTALAPTATEFAFFSKNKNRYAWLHTVTGFDVNTYKNNLEVCRSFNVLIEDYKVNYAFYGDRARNYVITNHSMKNVANEIVKIIGKNTFTLEEVENCGLFKHSSAQKRLLKMKNIYKSI